MKFFLAIYFFATSLWSQSDWPQIETSFFRIYYQNSEKVHADRTASLFESAHSEIAAQLGLQLTQPVRVILCGSEKTFTELTGNFIPHWGAGVADASQSLIILKSPSLTGNPDRLPKLVRHELTHIIVGQAIKNPQSVPRWFNEGIAIYFSYDEYFADGDAISKALFSDSIISLDEIDDVLNFQHAKANLAYEESYSFTLYLVETFGMEKMIELLSALNRSPSFEESFRHVFAVDLYDVEIAWYKFIKKKYRWNFLLNFETFLWIFIPLLFILSFIAVKIRNRKTLKKWEMEDRIAGDGPN